LIYNGNAGSSTHAPNPLAQFLPAALPVAPAGEPVWIEEARDFIRAETGDDPEIVATMSEEEAVATLRDATARGVGLVIAAGGDGTLRSAANVLAGTETVLGILPKGTVNVFARELSIPLDDPLGALRIALHGRTRRVDVGCVRVPSRPEGQYFLLMASLGFDATAVDNVNLDVKETMGAGAYVLAGLSTLANYVPPWVTLTGTVVVQHRGVAPCSRRTRVVRTRGGGGRVAPPTAVEVIPLTSAHGARAVTRRRSPPPR
jgi:diacylglycerol kinase family enzyme